MYRLLSSYSLKWRCVRGCCVRVCVGVCVGVARHSVVSVSAWEWLQQVEASLRLQQQWSTHTEIEQVKDMLLTGSPALLYLTGLVSALHLLFDFLAFKNGARSPCGLRVSSRLTLCADVQFWRGSDLRGVSLSSVLLDAVCQCVVFLYLCEQDTSLLVLLTVGLGVLVDAWKVPPSNLTPSLSHAHISAGSCVAHGG